MNDDGKQEPSAPSAGSSDPAPLAGRHVADPPAVSPTDAQGGDLANRIRLIVMIVLLLVMSLELVLLLFDWQWLNGALILAIMAATLSPWVLKRWLNVDIPPEFQVMAVIFIFGALFLGEIRDYYERFWWWDVALHVSSGLLLGILGFLLIFILNESDRVNLHLRPHFMAWFAFLFAVAAGAIWEIFEFAVDQLFGAQMQKPTPGDPSGLTDTMWDLIVDTIGALIISLIGWWYARQGERSFIESWIRKFIQRNPRLFRKRFKRRL